MVNNWDICKQLDQLLSIDEIIVVNNWSNYSTLE